MILTSGLSYRPCWIIQKSQKCHFEWSKEPKFWFLAFFLSLVHQIDFKSHIVIELSDLKDLAGITLMLNHSKVTKLSFWMIQIAKNEVFGHFIEFGPSDWLCIAYFDRTKWCAWVGHPITHAGSFKNRKNAFLNDPNSQKKMFLAIFLSLVPRIDLIIAYFDKSK